MTLLHYVPVRKSLDIDVVEERMSFAGARLYLPAKAETVVEFHTREGLLLETKTGAYVLPAAEGRLLLEAPGYFRDNPGFAAGAVMPLVQWR